MSLFTFFGVLLYCAATSVASQSQSHLDYLDGFQRLNTSCTDYYFSCTITGVFIQWIYQDDPLAGFGIGSPGRVVVDSRSNFEYTSTILSLERQEDGQARFVSLLVVSFNGNRPDSFDVTCNSLEESMSITANKTTRGVDNSKENDGIVLDYVLSRNDTHIFVCGVPNSFQFLDVEGPVIGFGSGDHIGQDRTVLTDNREAIDLQGVLIARQPFQSIALLLVTNRSEVTVTCFYGNNQVQLSAISAITALPDETTKHYTTEDNTTEVISESIDTTGVTARNLFAFITPIVVSISLLVLMITIIGVIVTFLYLYHRRKTCKVNLVTSEMKYKNEEEMRSKEAHISQIEQGIVEAPANGISITENNPVVRQPVDGKASSWNKVCGCSVPKICSKEKGERCTQSSEDKMLQSCPEKILKDTNVVPFNTFCGDEECGNEECEFSRTYAVYLTPKKSREDYFIGQLKSEPQSGADFPKNCLSIGAEFAAGTYSRKSQIIENADGYIMEKSGTSDKESLNQVPGIDNELSQAMEKSHLDSDVSKNVSVRIVELKNNLRPVELVMFSALFILLSCLFILLSYFLVVFLLTPVINILPQQLHFFREFPLCSFIYREQFSYIFHADANWLSWLSVQVAYWRFLLVGKTVVIFLEECVLTEQRTRIWQKNLFFFVLYHLLFRIIFSSLQLVHGRIRTALHLRKRVVLARNLLSTQTVGVVKK